MMTPTETLQYCELLRQCEPDTLTYAFFNQREMFRHALDEQDDEWAEACTVRLHAIEVRWFQTLGYWPEEAPEWHTKPF